MCGRFGRQDDVHKLAKQFGAIFDETLLAPPTYNAAPQSWQLVIRLDREGKREIVSMRWGLVPSWSKDGKANFSTFNARSETILETNTFRNAMRKRRCLVPASFFYEWKKLENGQKQPYCIGLVSGETYAYAGLWERWEGRDDDSLESFTVITCDPNELVEEFHDRMPVILDAKDYDRWLEPGDPVQPPVDLLRPYPAEKMRAWKVGPEVGNVRNNHPGLFDPLQ